MKTKEEILGDFGCAEIPFDENVTMYYPAVLSSMQEYADQECDELRRQIDELKAAKPDIIVPGEEEIEEYARSESSSNPHGNDGGFMVNYNKSKRNQIVRSVGWAINRIKELNK